MMGQGQAAGTSHKDEKVELCGGSRKSSDGVPWGPEKQWTSWHNPRQDQKIRQQTHPKVFIGCALSSPRRVEVQQARFRL